MAIEVKKTKKTIAGYTKCGKPLMTGLEILESVEANVAIEALQTWLTESPGLSNIIQTMKNDKHVITSNKDPWPLRSADFTKPLSSMKLNRYREHVQPKPSAQC